MSLPWRVPWTLAALALASTACSAILEIGDLDAGPGSDGESESGDAPAGCTPTFDDASLSPASLCPASEAGSAGCAPLAPIDSSVLRWMPVKPRKACTSQDIDAFVNACATADASSVACGAFMTDNLTCYECIIPANPGYGAVIQLGEYSFLNIGGCVAALDPCNVSCGIAIEQLSECQSAACGTPCRSATVSDREACPTQAESCPCLAYHDEVHRCEAAILAADGGAARCFSSITSLTTYGQNLKPIAQALCGMP